MTSALLGCRASYGKMSESTPFFARRTIKGSAGLFNPEQIRSSRTSWRACWTGAQWQAKHDAEPAALLLFVVTTITAMVDEVAAGDTKLQR